MDLRFIKQKRNVPRFSLINGFVKQRKILPKWFWRGIWHGQKWYIIREMKILEKDIDILLAGLLQ
ncbi:hypothetical protein GCM10009597_46750 [Peribacillus frigoritolerans]